MRPALPTSEYGNGGEAATGFLRVRANARPARRAGPIVRPPRFRPEWGLRRRPIHGPSIGQTDFLVAKWGGRATARSPTKGMTARCRYAASNAGNTL